MKSSKRFWMWTGIVSMAALISSNVWWLYAVLDLASIQKYLAMDLDRCTAQRAELELLSLDLSRGTPKEEVLEILATVQSSKWEPFEKEGYLHSGRLSFRFDREAKLVEVTTDPYAEPERDKDSAER